MTRTYVITGAGSGIGKVTAEILTGRGERVIGVDLRGADITADLSTVDGRRDAAAEAARLAGGVVDGAIACAGLALPKVLTARVNFFGATEFLEALQPALAASDAPRVAIVSSMASLQPVAEPLVEALLAGDEDAAVAIASQLETDPQLGGLIYPSSKRAVSRWVRREAPQPRWAGAGIAVNAVGPGTVVTPMTSELLATPEGRALVDTMVPMPLNSHQGPESIAKLLIWLTSVENSHCCGQTIYCDGGADAVLRGDDVWSWNDEAMQRTLGELFAKLG